MSRNETKRTEPPAGSTPTSANAANLVVCVERIWAVFDKLRQLRSSAWNLDIDRWDWSSGVGLWGIMRCHEVLADRRCMDFLVAWTETNAPRRLKGSVNHVLPAYVVQYLWRATGDPRYRQICDEYATWCLQEAVRTSNGGLAHVWHGGLDDYRHQLWINSLFMAGMFMLRYGVEAPDEALFVDGRRQFQLHLDLLYNPSERLCLHGYHCLAQRPIGDYWGRGNGWMVASVVESMTWLPAGNSLGRKVAEAFQETMLRAHGLRMPDGRLRTMLLGNDAHPETTGSALFGYAALRGYRLGVLPPIFRDWGFQLARTMCALISPDGRIADCSYGASPESRDAHLQRPCEQSLYADGIMLAFLSEASAALQAIPHPETRQGNGFPAAFISDLPPPTP